MTPQKTLSSNLNEAQRRAVHTTDGRVLILAGAGSGKTSVLVHRIAHLIEKGVSPTAILGLTFTNKAAQEMRQRVSSFIGKNIASQVTLCTFHSFCMKVLRKEIHRMGYTSHFSIYDERDIKRVLKQLARDSLDIEKELPSIESTYSEICKIRNQGEKSDGKHWHDAFAKELHDKLATSLRAYNAVDFDTLLTLTVDLFVQFPEVLAEYQETFRYIMIDEYQDTNPIQYKLASLLSKKYNNLCVVGDDDQSIYGWRGAEVEHILQFTANTTVKLEQNYRSTPIILHAANEVIKNNEKRHEKTLFSTKQSDTKIVVFHAPTEDEEAEAVINRILHYKTEHSLRWSDFAILYRSNILSRSYEKGLMNASWKKGDQWVRGIPYQIFGGTELYERAEVKDVLAYIKVMANPSDHEALLRIINVPRRGISEKTLDTVTQYQRTHKKKLYPLLQEIVENEDFPLEISQRGLSGIRSFLHALEEAKQQKGLRNSVEHLLTSIEYKKAIEEDVKSDAMRTFKWENVVQSLSLLEEYEKSNPGHSLADFAAETMLDTQSSRESKKGGDAVTLMTFHSAKGLEFPYVFLVGLEDHIIPHEKSLAETGIEEERRLLYVAITRAKERLFLSMARQRNRHGKMQKSTPSRFLFEIPQDILDIQSHKFITD